MADNLHPVIMDASACRISSYKQVISFGYYLTVPRGPSSPHDRLESRLPRGGVLHHNFTVLPEAGQ